MFPSDNGFFRAYVYPAWVLWLFGPCLPTLDCWHGAVELLCRPQPSSQKSTLSGSGSKMTSFLVVPLMRHSYSRGCIWKSNQNSLSLPAAQTGEAEILMARSPRCSDMMFSGSLSIMTFSTMCFTGILFPAARFKSSSMRVSSQKCMESLFSRFSLDAPLACERPLHRKPTITRMT